MQQTIYKKNYWAAYGLFLVFIGPLAFATWLYAFNEHFNFHSICSGKLITPPIASQTLTLHEKSLLGKWQLVSIDLNHTDQNTLNSIYLALGKERERIETRSIHISEVPVHLENSALFIIDPKGWIILHYSSLSNPKGILNDVRRLLRLSHVG